MLRFVSLCFGTVVRLFRARRSLLIENLALRQQLVEGSNPFAHKTNNLGHVTEQKTAWCNTGTSLFLITDM
jgi:hypothetical protein